MSKARVITWTEFFALKKSKRNWEKAGGVVCGLCGFLGASYYFGAVKEFDPLEQPFGLDPALVSGGATVLVGGVGAVSGILAGGQLWRLTRSRVLTAALDWKEKDFFTRIERNRPKQVKMNLQHPMPDFYGERISSVAEYRKWLKDVSEWCSKMGVSRK